MYRLIFHSAGETHAPVTGVADRLMIGRAASCGLRLTDAGVHDQHAVLERRADGYYICDLTGGTGVHVNGVVITNQRLATGDEIEIGAVRFVFEIVHEPPPERRAFDPWQGVAAGIVVALIIGQLALIAWIFAQPHPHHARTDLVVSKPPEALPLTTPIATNAPVLVPLTTSPVPAVSAPEVLSKMLKITRVDRPDAATLRIHISARVGDRQLATDAVAVSVQCSAGTPIQWLPVPANWENFKGKDFIVHLPTSCAGFIVRTYYRNQLQDVIAYP